ncbi:UAA transporter [Trichodelitschia bisporula]|uniref:UDP-galactose transporter homolog 1 n=1 Tax=Trichodelitschia bisporula TaxID=703511 RepID=A0A6G1HW62_9PEZI|nr:UAA transporter [Trichodelitschia bisporula]
MQSNGIVHDIKPAPHAPRPAPTAPTPKAEAGFGSLVFCVGGIYASFLTWAVLQERITTTPYGHRGSRFTHAVFLNTVQSAFAAVSGLAYLLLTTSHPHRRGPAPIFPSRRILAPLLLISLTSSLASPFGYAALEHIDYITFILAKSCKLLPVMFLHVTLFRKRYSLYKYAVVALVTLGVAVFTLHHPSTASKAAKHGSKQAAASPGWGLFLLGVNLLFDGLTNSTQDQIFTSFRPYSGPQMMCAQNLLSTALTTSFLLLAPFAPPALTGYLGINATELRDALAFIRAHPSVGWDVLGFAACGAVGQVFIFHTLQVFSSLLLVTVTVTRKMLTMVVSVLWFGHSISRMQWLGVGLVFGGVGAEGIMNRREKVEKERKARAREASVAGQKEGKEL